MHTFSRFAGIAAASLMLAFSATATAQNSQPTPMSQVPKVDALSPMEGDHLLGDPQAKVTIIEYASLTCPHCMAYHLETFPQIKEQYIDTGKVAFIFRSLPFNEPALRGAMLAECSGKDFYKYINVLMKSQDKWAFDGNYMSSLRNIATIGGMGEDAFNACMDNKAIQEKIVAGLTVASQQLGVSSTPTTFINGEKIEGFRTFEQIKERIAPLLGDTAKKSAE